MSLWQAQQEFPSQVTGQIRSACHKALARPLIHLEAALCSGIL